MNRLSLVLSLGLCLMWVSLAAAQAPKPAGADAPLKPKPPRIDLVRGYSVVLDWPSARPSKPWEAMAGVAIDREGNIWTLNRGVMPIQVFSPDGKLLKQWGDQTIKRGHQLRIDRAGHVWVPDLDLHVIQKYDADGKLLMTIGTPGKAGTDDKTFFLPCDVAVTSNGDIFVADGYGNNRVVHCDKNGRFIKAWGALGVKPGEFSLPHAIVADSRDRLYVADRNNNRIQVFNTDGKLLKVFEGLCVPWTLAITDADELYVCGSSPMIWRKEDELLGIPPKDQVVMRLDTDGRVLSWWAFPFEPDAAKQQPGQLNWVHGIAVDRAGNLYLGDIMGKRVQKFEVVGRKQESSR